MKKFLITAALLLTGIAVFAQGGYKGSISVEVVTEDGSPLPGAVAELTADTFARSFVSDANGAARFLGLQPSTYQIKITFTGFNTYVRPNIIVDTGQNVRLTATMTPSTQQEELVVTAESPLIDSTKVGTATVLTEDELSAVPQSRDPWSVLQTVPGIQTDRINVGGSESGQQSNFASKGDDGDNATWVMDGIEFVDPGARGATQSYLDFSSFSQIGVTTGGSDVAVRSGGAALNFVTKQGSNNHQGSVRLLYADQDFQSSHDGIFTNSGQPLGANRIAETFEKSFEIGGPLIKDRLWYWGAFSQNSVNQIVISGQEDRTELRNVSFKLHGDLTSTTRFNAFYTEGDKIKNGRGASPARPINTTWDQEGPTPIYKFEVSQLIGQNTELSFLAARVDGKFSLTSKGGTDAQIGFDTSAGVWDNSTFIDYATTRPVRQYEVKGNTFISSSNMDHELSYGFQYKEAAVTSLTSYARDGVLRYFDGAAGVGQTALLFREGNPNTELEYTTLTLQDTMTYGNWTFKAGLRYDRQEGNNIASTARANAFAPDILPELAYEGAETPFTWSTIAPRLGATYSFGDENQYLIRGSVSQFYETLGSEFITPSNPVTVKYSYHTWNDTNGDLQVDQGELSESLASNVNLPINEIDSDLKAPKVDELVIGAEWAINPEFTIGLSSTFRERSDEIWTRLNGNLDPESHYDRISATTTDPNTGQEVDVSYYAINEAGAAALDGLNTVTTNRPGYKENYFGLELTATKRLSNRWMMRANITYNDWTRDVPSDAIQDPNNFQDGRNEDGGLVGIQSAGSGSKNNTYFGSATWTANINGLYQLPWDLTISTNINAREGFSYPYAFQHTFVDAAGLFNNIFVKYDEFDANRGDDILYADFKLTKTFTMGGRTKVELAAEIFNAFNDDTIMARNLQVGVSTSNDPLEVVSPRVGRFSATVQF